MEFEVPKELMEKQLQFLKKVSSGGKIKIGVNEVTKAVEREKAKLVLIASDVDPKEIVMHLPLLCKEKKIPYSFVEAKKDLGENAGIEVGTATIAVTEEGKEKKDLLDIAKKLAQLGGVPMEGAEGQEEAGEKKEEKEEEASEKKEEKAEKEKVKEEKPKKEKKEEEKEEAPKEEKPAEKKEEKAKKAVEEKGKKEEGKEDKKE